MNVNYTNKAENPKCFMTVFQIAVQQEGMLCQMTAGDPERENHVLDQVPPNETVLISEAFLIDTEKETTVSVSAYFGEDNYLEETILPHTDGTITVCE